MNIRYPLYEGVYRILTANGKRDTEKFERICPRNVNE